MNDYSPGLPRNSDPFLKKLRRKRRITGIVVVASIAIIVAGATVALGRIAANRATPKATQQSIADRWLAKDFAGVYEACQASLAISPLDPFYLVFNGFSAFYLGIAESDGERRSSRMDEAIFSLRKALIDKDAPLRAEATYVLGKAYFLKGIDYYNEAIDYLEEAARNGYSQSDTWEYLALAAQGTGSLGKSVAYFDKAMAATAGSPELTLAAATANAAAGDAAKAERLATEALAMTSDEYLAERCGFLLGDLLMKTGRQSEALARYEAIKDKNPQSADAWYYQGLALFEMGDPIGARAAWRKAVSIDPMHMGARQKLSERS
ncbi:MAG: tetratricopeptide repeat protein [Spirochaetes bacterium]|nr:tetratricopeptide repeat protein [Spirochaetota bacterium]MBU1081335.1 tetratricopeptide repeat protein [Spirochaetota bacterium]